MQTRLAPKNIQIIGNELAIAWEDNLETYITLENLRLACPCAACCGEPDALGNVMKPEVRHTVSSFELRGWQLIGGYSFQPTWADGHATGLYTFRYLRKLGGLPDAPQS
jgi:DUF971 family protein